MQQNSPSVPQEVLSSACKPVGLLYASQGSSSCHAHVHTGWDMAPLVLVLALQLGLAVCCTTCYRIADMPHNTTQQPTMLSNSIGLEALHTSCTDG